ncbi:type II toxin-antitoxin system PemK/MazF family toxin [Mammaliicoccus sciuri]|uniref:type II toxin-antitoxin system PemK/MazF family toxin n=1 Tax=Staphylococcaceae TaxID=90964 RepID=UPI001FB1DD86|nr:type II toxin-antitoxin system PemK/MazF family toxin [Mammaliicoccus sciuri]MCJ0911732.1 type II toxin-antitoxin system PemK/MazF family toxin [Mammaliicoccus sciuri]
MVKQFDVIKVNSPDESKSELYVVVSNDFVNSNSPYIWTYPIFQRDRIYLTDIELVTKKYNYDGVIDCGIIGHIDLNKKTIKVLDKLQPRIQKKLIESIQAHIETI